MSTTSEQAKNLALSDGQATTWSVPTSLSVKYATSLSKWICFAKARLDLQDSNDQNVFTLELPKGWYGDLILQDARAAGQGPIASAHCRGTLHTYHEISIPSNGGGGVEILRHKGSFRQRWWFAFQINNDVERFEWRPALGSRIKSLGASHWGWELVRFDSSVTEADESKEREESPVDGAEGSELSKDGRGQVVARWGNGNCFKSLSSVGELQFLESGAFELTPRWQLMVLLSCMVIWQRTMRDSVAGAVIASS